MAGHEILKKVFGKPNINGHHLRKHSSGNSSESRVQTRKQSAGNSEDDQPPTPPPKDQPEQSSLASVDVETYVNSFKKSRTNSIYSLSRISFANQLSQLTSLNLPDASSLSTSIASIPNAPAAANTLAAAAEQIGKWLQKASEVLKGLDAEDDVEWAAAGGRDGLGEVDTAIGKFEGLIGIYVTAIEDLQEREDIGKVPTGELKAVVDQMEIILKEWDSVRKLLRGVKGQVELAMEWEELWNHVLGDIGQEMENLINLVFEMEEQRHKAWFAEPTSDGTHGLDMQELQTIVEEMPAGGRLPANHRFSMPPAFAVSSPISPTGLVNGHEDSSLLALFARMQPLRASLDFLPMTLSNFYSRADSVLPTACQELEARRKGLEKKWKKLEGDAEGLRRELGEDRWLLVFRNAGRQAQKLCESVERSIGKLQEAFEVGAQHNNPPALAKKVENYEAKKTHYGPAIERILGIIEKGVKDRLTVNGEISRLQSETRTRWTRIEQQMKEMDFALDELNLNKNQQLRDSISSIVSMDHSAVGSSVDTPRSSPASSVVMAPVNSHKGDIPWEGTGRRSSTNTTRPTNGRPRYFSMPPVASVTHLPRQNPVSSVSTSESWLGSRDASPTPISNQTSSTPTPGSRPKPPKYPQETKPRWNSSPKVNHYDFPVVTKPLTITTPPPGHKSPLSFRSPRSVSSSNVTLPSPLGRSTPGSVLPLPKSPLHYPRHSESQISPMTDSSQEISTSPMRPTHSTTQSTTNLPRSRPKAKHAPIAHGTPPSSSRRQSSSATSSPVTPANNPSPSTQRPPRPGTAMANTRRSSMLPVPKHLTPVNVNGNRSSSPAPGRYSLSNRASISGLRYAGRESAMGYRDQ